VLIEQDPIHTYVEIKGIKPIKVPSLIPEPPQKKGLYLITVYYRDMLWRPGLCYPCRCYEGPERKDSLCAVYPGGTGEERLSGYYLCRSGLCSVLPGKSWTKDG